jgi:hypothetical protein
MRSDLPGMRPIAAKRYPTQAQMHDGGQAIIMTHMSSRHDSTPGGYPTQPTTSRAVRAPRGFLYSSCLLGLTTLLCAFAVAEGRFVLDPQNNAIAKGSYFLAWLGHNPFGWQTLPWLIADIALPLGATLCTFFAYRRLILGHPHARAVGLSATVVTLIAAIVSLLAAGWMIEAGSGNVNTGQQPWYFNEASVSVAAFGGAAAAEFVAASITVVTVLRQQAKSRTIIISRSQSKPSEQAGSN